MKKNQPIECSAADCIGKHSDLIGATHLVKHGENSRALWESADPTKNHNSVLLQRLVPVDGGVRIVKKYVDLLDLVVLVPLADDEDE